MDEIERQVGDLIKRAEKFNAGDVSESLRDSLEVIRLASISIEMLESMRELRSGVREGSE